MRSAASKIPLSFETGMFFFTSPSGVGTNGLSATADSVEVPTHEYCPKLTATSPCGPSYRWWANGRVIPHNLISVWVLLLFHEGHLNCFYSGM